MRMCNKKQVKISVLLIIFLALSIQVVSSAPPTLPVLLYGKVVNEKGYGIPGSKVSVQWKDDSGKIQLSEAYTFTPSQAKSFGNSNLVGHYRFVGESINAQTGSIVTIRSMSTSISIKAIPGRLVEVPDIVVKDGKNKTGIKGFFDDMIDYLFSVFGLSNEEDSESAEHLEGGTAGTDTQSEGEENIDGQASGGSSGSASSTSNNRPIRESEGDIVKNFPDLKFSETNTQKPSETIIQSGQGTVKQSKLSDKDTIYILGSIGAAFVIVIIIVLLILGIKFLKKKRKKKKTSYKDLKVSLKGLSQIKAGQFMNEKYPKLKPEDSVLEAIELFIMNNINIVPIVSGKSVVGVINKKDIVFKINNPKKVGSMKVKEIMRKKFISCKPTRKMGDIYSIMLEKNLNEIIIAKSGKFMGTVDYFDMLNVFSNTNFIIETPPKMGDAMAKDVKIINPKTTLNQLKDLFMKTNTEYAVIIENKKPIGIVTLKDLMNALKKEMDFDKTDVRNFMSTSLISMNPGTSIYKGFKIALERRFNQIPIIDMHKVVVGIVNVKYLVRVYYEFVASLNEEDRAKFLKEVDSNNNYNDNLAGT